MEKSNKTLWLTLVLIFVGMFLLASVFATTNTEKSTQTSPTKLIQTYKTYETPRTIGTNNYQDKPIQTYYLDKHKSKACRDRVHCYYDYDNRKKTSNKISYTNCNTEKTRKSFLGDYVKEYSVYVTNNGKTGRYFTVTFNFEDKNGYDFSQSVTQYLRTGEKKNFVYKDIQYEKNEILHWAYDITPENY